MFWIKKIFIPISHMLMALEFFVSMCKNMEITHKIAVSNIMVLKRPKRWEGGYSIVKIFYTGRKNSNGIWICMLVHIKKCHNIIINFYFAIIPCVSKFN